MESQSYRLNEWPIKVFNKIDVAMKERRDFFGLRGYRPSSLLGHVTSRTKRDAYSFLPPPNLPSFWIYQFLNFILPLYFIDESFTTIHHPLVHLSLHCLFSFEHLSNKLSIFFPPLSFVFRQLNVNRVFINNYILLSMGIYPV